MEQRSQWSWTSFAFPRLNLCARLLKPRHGRKARWHLMRAPLCVSPRLERLERLERLDACAARREVKMNVKKKLRVWLRGFGIKVTLLV